MSELSASYQSLLEHINAVTNKENLNHLDQDGLMSVFLQADKVYSLLLNLRDHEKWQVNFLTSLNAVHFPDLEGKELQLVYHLHSWRLNLRFRIKCHIPIEHPVIHSVTSVYKSANWMERETYDFFGIEFEGHPDLRRILNVDHMEYFPLRKEYPLEDASRTDKEDKFFGR